MKLQDQMSRMTRAQARFSTYAATGLSSLLLALPVWAQKFPNLPITDEQNATARKVAQAGVPLSELAPNAPDTYVIKPRDTLWDISKLYLRSPWRWPELWGMNMDEVRNPHLIFPGQTLYLIKRDGRALLSSTPPGTEGAAAEPGSASPTASGDTPPQAASGGIPTVRLSPRVRSDEYRGALSTLRISAIEPFLAEPMIVEEKEFQLAPRIVAAADARVVIGRGDRVYARGPSAAPLMDDQEKLKQFRIFRNAKPLLDPDTGEVLGYEAEFLGKAVLARGESQTEATNGDGRPVATLVPATIDVQQAKSEILVGDRLAPEPEREYLNFVPRAPGTAITGRVVSIYGSNAVVHAAQNQVVVINRGQRDGIESGHVLAILKDGRQLIDGTDSARAMIKLPNERNGLLMVFRVFDRLAYGLILDITDSVRVGDRLVTPQQQ